MLPGEQPDRREVVASLWEFRKNFDAFCGGMLNGLDWTGVLAAGGSVLHNLLLQKRRDWYKYVGRR